MMRIVTHGGAGRWRDVDEVGIRRVLEQAAEKGMDAMQRDGDAVAGVVAAVCHLEDDERFNAGTGSVLNFDGDAEMDAGLAVGHSHGFGAVAALVRVKNPIAVARLVLEQTDHCLLSGRGALRFARALDVPDHDPVTPLRREQWERGRKRLLEGCDPYLSHTAPVAWEMEERSGDTVGAVAVDAQGKLASATSTGGTALKLPGRIGDSPVPGAGTLADERCAVSATGHGELILRFVTAARIAEQVRRNVPIVPAVRNTLSEMAEQIGDEAGVIAIDHDGNIAIAHRTPAMPFAVGGEGQRTYSAMRLES